MLEPGRMIKDIMRLDPYHKRERHISVALNMNLSAKTRPLQCSCIVPQRFNALERFGGVHLSHRVPECFREHPVRVVNLDHPLSSILRGKAVTAYSSEEPSPKFVFAFSNSEMTAEYENSKDLQASELS